MEPKFLRNQAGGWLRRVYFACVSSSTCFAFLSPLLLSNIFLSVELTPRLRWEQRYAKKHNKVEGKKA